MLEHLEKGIKFDQTIVAIIKIIKNTSEKKNLCSCSIRESLANYLDRIGWLKCLVFVTDTIWIVGPLVQGVWFNRYCFDSWTVYNTFTFRC
jgi:hypothetical protein